MTRRASAPDAAEGRLLRFSFEAPGVRGEWIELGSAWREVWSRHRFAGAATALLGELTAASLLLSATLKQRGSMTTQIVGDGPVRLAVVQSQADGRFRATLKLAEDATPASLGTDVQSLLNPGGRGRFVITIDPHEKAPTKYQGIVPIEGDSIAAMLEGYMARSEQLPTRLWLAADDSRVAGLLLQRMPDAGAAGAATASGATARGSDPDGWDRLQMLAQTLTPSEMLATNAEILLERLFWQERVSGLEARALRFECHCDLHRVANMLRMLGKAEVESILAEQNGEVIVHCEYCNTRYAFDRVDCAGLFVTDAVTGNTTRQ